MWQRVADYAGFNWYMTKTSQPGGNSSLAKDIEKGKRVGA